MIDEPRNARLEAAVFDRRDDPEGYLVLGDWLMQQGHPRGELIALMLRGVDNERTRELQAELLTPPPQIQCDWRWGFVYQLTSMGPELPAGILEALLAEPSCRFVERMRMQGKAARIASAGASWLRALHLTSYAELTDLPALGAGLPRLTSLALHADAVEGRHAVLPQLERLEVFVRSRAPSTIEAIASAQVPALQTLSITGRLADPLVAFGLARLQAPKLRTFVLRDVPIDLGIFEALVSAPWVRTLESLRLVTCIRDHQLAQRCRKDMRLAPIREVEITVRGY